MYVCACYCPQKPPPHVHGRVCLACGHEHWPMRLTNTFNSLRFRSLAPTPSRRLSAFVDPPFARFYRSLLAYLFVCVWEPGPSSARRCTIPRLANINRNLRDHMTGVPSWCFHLFKIWWIIILFHLFLFHYNVHYDNVSVNRTDSLAQDNSSWNLQLIIHSPTVHLSLLIFQTFHYHYRNNMKISNELLFDVDTHTWLQNICEVSALLCNRCRVDY